MKNIRDYLFQNPNASHYVTSLALLVAVASATMLYTSSRHREVSWAAEPTFTMSQSGNSLKMVVDGTNEGDGLLGAETHITYDKTLMEISSVEFNPCPFDSCLNLSTEAGTLKFFAASANPSNGGKAVTQKQTFATINLKFLSDKEVPFAFTKCQVIEPDGVVDDDRDCTGIAAKKNAPVVANVVCGNNILEGTEQCDDGNKVDGDGCSAACTTEEQIQTNLCGNKALDSGEQCDDGNTASGDGCSATCQNENQGQPAACGNNIVESGEECDGGDGCSGICKKEEKTPGQTPTPVCGNKTVETGEDCDDGNTSGGDRCSATCQTETSLQVAQLNSIAVSVATGYTASPEVDNTVPLNAWAYVSGSAPSNITSKATYLTSNAAVAQVSGSTVTAVAPGSATITASYTEGGVTKTNQITITVKAPPVVVSEPVEEEEETAEEEEEAEATGEEEVTQEGGTSQQEEPSAEEEGEGLRPSAQELAAVTAQAGAAADETVRTQTVVTQAAVVIARPLQKQDVVTKLDLCRQQYPDVDFATSADQDSDGLSNKTECYAGTDPTEDDTDNDGYSDGSEINELATNPLVTDDWGTSVPEMRVTITDPQPGWILRTVEVAGFTPEDTKFVSAVAFPAEQKGVIALESALADLMAQTDTEGAQTKLVDLLQALSEAEAFVGQYGTDYDYDNLAQVTESLRAEASQWEPDLAVAAPEQPLIFSEGFSLALEQLQVLHEEKVVLGTTVQFSDADLSGRSAKKFALLPQESLENNKLYDLVAVASFANGSTQSSVPVRFGLDDATRVAKPRPRSIGEKTIPEDSPALSHLWIGNVRADSLKNGVELEIDQSRPVVSGDTEFSSQVFAVWNSIVLASSVISDSEEGAFSIQAPKDLEPDVGHRVTLYAVKADESSLVARSESVNVFFRIKPVATGFRAALWALGIFLALTFFIVLLRRKAKKEELPMALEAVTETAVAPLAHEEAEQMKREAISAEEAAKVFAEQMPAQTPSPASPAPSPMMSEIEKEFDEAFKTAGAQGNSEYYEKLEDQAREEQTKTQKMPL